MSERQELEQLRRLDRLERKARGPVQVAPEPVFDPAAGMSTSDKLLANIGAGMADLGTGVKSLYTDMFGSEDEKRAMQEEVARKREIDKRLAGTVRGGSALQVVGGILPTLAIPGIPVATGAGRLATAAAGAGTGAAYGAIVPRGEGESRTNSILLGGALGGALPLSMSALNAMTTPFRGQSRAAQEVTDAMMPQGASNAQRRQVLEQTMQQMRQQAQAPASSIPLTVAARLGNPELARLEAGSRARSGANFYDFDQNQARAVASAFDDATAEVGELAARRAAREANINARKAAAYGAADAARFNSDLGAFRANLELAKKSPDASNPAVLSMLQSIEREIDRLGPEFGPGNLGTIRHNLSGKANPISQNAYAAAPRDSVATRSVINEIDRILNDVTDNKWQNVVTGYYRDQGLVDAAKAAGRVREAYYDTATGRVRGVSADPAGDIPKITEAGLGRALDAARGPDKSVLLSDPSRQRLEGILEALRRQNIVQGVKRSATAGGGSNTASDQFAAGTARAMSDVALDAIGGPAATVGRGLFTGLRNTLDARKDRALAEALQNEQAFIQMLQTQAAREGSTLDRSEVARLLRYMTGN